MPTRRLAKPALAATAAATVLASCLVSQSSATAAPQPAVAGATGPVVVDGQSQPVFNADPATWIRQELWVETESDSDRDGRLDRVHVSLARPAETADGVKVPVIYEDSPYYAGLANASNWDVDHELGDPPSSRPETPPFTARNTSPVISRGYESTWIPRGFAVVHSESPGTGLSDGCPTSGGRNETLGGKAVVDWLGGRAKGFASRDAQEPVPSPSWTTGNVGMTGTSYNGTLPIAVATTGVPNLKAIVPVSAISNWYDYYRSQGLVRAPGGYQGEDLDVLADAVLTRSDRPVCQPALDEIAREQDRVTGDYSPFWAERDYMQDVGNVRAATLVAHGFNDFNVMTKNAAQFYAALRAQGVPHQVYWHQGGHGGAPTDTLMNKWFTRYLWDVQNGVEGDPRAWVVREGASRQNPTPYAEWPVPGSAPLTLRPGGNGSAVGTLTTGPRSMSDQRIVDDASVRLATLAAAHASRNRLLFTTEPLARDTHLSGTPSVTLTARYSAARMNQSVALVSYAPDGKATVLTRGWADPRNRTSLSRENPVNANQPVRTTVNLQPKDSVVPAGSRLGIVIYSSDNEFTVRPAPGGTVDVDLKRTTVTLPVVGGRL
ncbi:Xaa-Pro dipeptidyl-peptidase [Knoellia koreensis]|uniref:Xaa-Pro dipeptidyl-peptidase n=1 Tax=Knoellia koreensis TaxID=2730921 RepID=A0A849HGY5_9MICO|nr:Xaa-Pro dipeptidyl-peptidase [Knoellia sp. DB2414S]NNM46512.1 Xaa-Pro dipeptidyl-peptidase [Knoellia sp. DB2414S]